MRADHSGYHTPFTVMGLARRPRLEPAGTYFSNTPRLVLLRPEVVMLFSRLMVLLAVGA